MFAPSGARRRELRQWAPAMIAAGCAWLLFVVVGDTPLSRASGMALAILGATASMRFMGFVASCAGGLTLALCPVFWSQTGGGASDSSLFLAAAGIALVCILVSWRVLERGDLGVGAGIAVFALIFWSQIGTAQSLRLTLLATAWLLYLLLDMLLLTNPRPGLKPARAPLKRHVLGLPFLFVLGLVNDSLATLFAPAILLALFLSYARLPLAYWLGFCAAIGAGVWLLWRDYLLPEAAAVDIMGWREAIRWIELGELVVAQFGVLGIALAIIGLARLSRWYPPLGTVTMIACATYILFGLVYQGKHGDVLITPLFIIQVMWMTYAVNTFGQWVNKSLGAASGRWIHIVSALYFLVPALFLARVIGS